MYKNPIFYIFITTIPRSITAAQAGGATSNLLTEINALVLGIWLIDHFIIYTT